MIYIIVYCVNVFVLNRWEDHYGIGGILPIHAMVILVLVIGILTAMLLRKLHNYQHQKQKKRIEDYYRNIDLDIIEIIKSIAIMDADNYKEGDIIPKHIIDIIKKTHKNTYTDKQLYDLCVKTFVSNI